jgi:hypothetical protein
MKQLKRAQRFERRAERKVGRAEKLEERAAQVRERHTVRPTGDVGPRAERRATRIEGRATRLRDRAQQYQNLSTALAPNLTPGGGATPTVPNEPSQTVPQTAQPDNWGQVNPRTPYAGGPTIQQQATPGTEQLVSGYYVGAGPSGQRYEDWLNQEYNQIEGRTTNRFADMFSKYVDVANREAGRQANQIATSLGSRGALYSSANLAQQADLRQRTSQDIANTAAQYQTTLENQRQQDWQNVMQGQAGVASAEMGGREAAMGRAWQDFLRQSDIPPEFGQGQQWASQRPSAGHYARY